MLPSKNPKKRKRPLAKDWPPTSAQKKNIGSLWPPFETSAVGWGSLQRVVAKDCQFGSGGLQDLQNVLSKSNTVSWCSPRITSGYQRPPGRFSAHTFWNQSKIQRLEKTRNRRGSSQIFKGEEEVFWSNVDSEQTDSAPGTACLDVSKNTRWLHSHY